MSSFYSTLYARFANLQVDRSFSARFVYPATGLLPFLKTGKGISDCIVKIPPIRVTNKTISYGPFAFEDKEFGQAAAVKLAVASTCLLSAKSVFRWLYRDHLQEWLASKNDALRAGYAINAILDTLARQRARQVEGEDFYIDIMQTADLLASALLPRSPKNFDVLAETAVASLILNVPVHVPAAVLKMAQNFITKLNALKFDPSRLVDALRDRISNNNTVEIGRAESGWDQLAKLADALYVTIDKLPGKWHSAYLPYSHTLAAGNQDSIFQSRIVTEKEFKIIRRAANKESAGNDAMWHEIFFELQREEKRREETLSKMSRAAKDLNIASAGFPTSDYVTYYKLYTELAAQIRRIVERVRMVKNVIDESTFEESGNIDLQVAIQAIASETNRNDVFIKDETIDKNESWTILVDSSLSLGGSSEHVKAVSICLAETAREIMGPTPWGMFAFSDELYCIKDFNEPYGNQAKARIGGLTQGGLSHIPDAIRTCRNMIIGHSKQDRNYLILVSDGMPTGYPGIEKEFDASVKELGKSGISLAAIGIVGSSIKKAIRNARVIDKPEDIVKEFMDVYSTLSA